MYIKSKPAGKKFIVESTLDWKVCPSCGKEYFEYPALSRKDNKTLICSLCAITEAFEAWEKHHKAVKA